MNGSENLTYMQGIMLQAYIEVEAMKAENTRCLFDGQLPTYGYDDFNKLIEKHGMHHNALITQITETY